MSGIDIEKREIWMEVYILRDVDLLSITWQGKLCRIRK